MTGNILIDLAISVVAIAILVGLSRLMFPAAAADFGQRPAAARLAFDEPDFAPVRWALDRASGVAIADNGAGEFALVRVKGGALLTRRLWAGAVTVQYRDGYLCIDLHDMTIRPVRMIMDAAEGAVWVQIFKLAAAHRACNASEE